jgi:hypothetical protein
MRSMLADSGSAGLLVGLQKKTSDLSGGILHSVTGANKDPEYPELSA